MDIFHVEKFECFSQFFFYESGVSFVPYDEIIDSVAFPKEDDQTNSIISGINLSDKYGTTGNMEMIVWWMNKLKLFPLCATLI